MPGAEGCWPVAGCREAGLETGPWSDWEDVHRSAPNATENDRPRRAWVGRQSTARSRLDTLLAEDAIDAWVDDVDGTGRFLVTTVDDRTHHYSVEQVESLWVGYVCGKRVAHTQRDRLEGIIE